MTRAFGHQLETLPTADVCFRYIGGFNVAFGVEGLSPEGLYVKAGRRFGISKGLVVSITLTDHNALETQRIGDVSIRVFFNDKLELSHAGRRRW